MRTRGRYPAALSAAERKAKREAATGADHKAGAASVFRKRGYKFARLRPCRSSPERLLDLEGQNSRPLHVSGARAVGLVLGRAHGLRAAVGHATVVAIAIVADKSDGCARVVIARVQEQLELADRENRHLRNLKYRFQLPHPLEPADRCRQIADANMNVICSHGANLPWCLFRGSAPEALFRLPRPC